MKTTLLLLIVYLSIFFDTRVSAAITIDSTSAATSSCQNNGVLTVFAHDSSYMVTYGITSGPLTRPYQTTDSFLSLPAGTYTVSIKSTSGQNQNIDLTVAGSYTVPNPNPKVIFPRCYNTQDYLLIGNLDSASGKGPYTWQLLPPSPDTTVVPQSSDTFRIHHAGTYTIQVTDACGDIQTRIYTFTSPAGISNLEANGPYSFGGSFMRCDSVFVNFPILLYGDSANLSFPLTIDIVNITTGGHTHLIEDSTVIDVGFSSNTLDYYPNYNTYSDALYQYMNAAVPYSSWGDQIMYSVTDGCGDVIGDTLVMPPMSITFDPWYNSGTSGCQPVNTSSFQDDLPPPSTWQLIDAGTGTVLETTIDSFGGGGWLAGYPPNKSYIIRVWDLCGDTMEQAFFWPTAVISAPYITAGVDLYASPCLDSTASISIQYANFTSGTTLVIDSGPVYSSSTKPGYSHTDTLVYPMVYRGPANNYIGLTNMPAGIYYYTVTDSCGNSFTGQLQVNQSDLASFGHSLAYVSGCINANEIIYNIRGSSVGYLDLLNISTGQYYSAPNSFAGSYADTVFNLPSGTYVITADYSATPGFANSNHCASTTDTIVIPPYQNPVLSAFSLIPCGSAFYLHCLADSSTGVLPYTYEVVSGPATFPAQSSNTFLLTNIGTYDIRLFDACGNSAVKAITIDSLPRGPEFIVRNIDSCYRAVVKGHVYTENSTLTDTITNAMGCDSIITVDSIFIQGNKNTHIFPTAADTFCSIHHNEIAADNVYAHYLWSDGSTASTLAVDQSGMYALTVTDDAGCASSDTIAVIVIDSAYIIDGWINDASACDLSPLHISLTLSTSDANYTWDATDAAPNDLQRTITDSGRYYFSVSNYCGTIVYELTVSEKACTENVYIPTAFTPNGDGTNDLFQVFTSYEAKVFDLKIFNRWGEKVYDTNNISKGWDGTYMGEIQPAGVYVYVADIVSLHNDTIHKEGSLSLIR